MTEHHDSLRDAGTPRTTEANGLDRAAAPWLHATEAMIDWYGAMFRLAFGLGRPNQNHTSDEPRPPLPQVDASPRVVQLPPSRPVAVRAKRKTKRPANGRARSSKVSGGRRHRKAA